MMKYVFSLVLIVFSFNVSAAEVVEVEMLTKSGDERMIYSPKVVYVNQGDTVKWIATDKTHNVEFIKGGTPEGVEKFRSKMNKDAEYTFEIPGVYAYKCTPHFGMGMIGFVVVDNNYDNLEAVRSVKFPGKSKKVAAELLDSIVKE